MAEKNDPNASRRQMEVDWSDWNGKSVEPEAEQSAPVERDCHKGGEHITKEDLRKDGEKIIEGARRAGFAQATDEQLFGHLVKSEEDLEKMEKDWENFFNNTMSEVREPIDNKVKETLPSQLDEAWESGKSFNDIIGEEEARKRGRYVGR